MAEDRFTQKAEAPIHSIMSRRFLFLIVITIKAHLDSSQPSR
ncbi:hypothetical protein C427_0762 [Paraglaciecola psychrophila 170]|uniref:Uncharacterized protein n=1 Tax=Paraglaciecola psychrophila 170 TaxID=1129794 RepID=K6ZW12_9ALTE|nr:hypothetical protein C427_0762 [Paraglaciecola psychrophila 170]GAC40076.1 hypothetical protein GPSY_4473 [Paraglaciecola psychrophila 170]